MKHGRCLSRSGLILMSALILSTFWQLVRAQDGRRELLDRVVATVNGEIITENEVLMRALGRLNRDVPGLEGALPDLEGVLNDMIDEVLLDEAAADEIKEIPDERISNRVEADIKRRIAGVGSREKFEAALKQRGWDLVSFKRFLRDEEERAYRIQSALTRRVHMTEDDVEKYVLELRQSGDSIDEFYLRQILIPLSPGAAPEEQRKAEALALALIEKIQQGVQFEQLAQEYSQDEATKEFGGSLGWIGRNDLQPAIRQAVENLKDGQFSQPVRTDRGIHIFKVVRKRGASEMLFEKMMLEAHKKWVEELRRKAQIKVSLSVLRP